MHVKEKKVTTKQDAGMLRAYVEIQDDGYFCKIVYHAVDDRQGKISRSKVGLCLILLTCDSKSFGARLIVRSVARYYD